MSASETTTGPRSATRNGARAEQLAIPTGDAVASAAAHACDGVDPNSDLYASGVYRCALAQVYTRRAIQAAKTQAG